MYKYSFEKLEVWQLSRELVKEIYRVTSSFPIEEQFGLTRQLRRASISISSNLAEGFSRKSWKDQAHFTQMSYGSLMEVLNQLIISVDLEMINKNDLDDLRPKIEMIGNKLNSFRNSQLTRTDKKS